jgi:nucleoside-diphosphate-sugar epimerase
VTGRVLVTGHLGYVGTVLTPQLSARGIDVIGCDVDLYRACSVAGMPPAPPLIKADFRDIEVSDLQGVDTLIHLAALSNDPLGDLDHALTHHINHRSAARLADRARLAGVRPFIAASSCSVYGAAGAEWLDEDSATAPLTAYARAKLGLEKALQEQSERGLEVIIMRPGTVFGFSPKMRFDLVVNNLAAWAMTTGRLHLKSTGNAWRPLLHVHDLCRAIIALVEAPAGVVAGQGFNIGFNELNLTVRELAESLLVALPGTRLEIAEGATPDQRSYRVDCSRLAGLLTDWRPTRMPAEVIDELRPLIDRLDLSTGDFEGPALARVAHLRERLRSGELDARLRHVDQPAY